MGYYIHRLRTRRDKTMMTSYGQIFASIAITGIISLVIYMIAMESKNGSNMAIIWLVSLIVFISVTGIGIISLGTLMAQDTAATMDKMHDEISAEYDLGGIAQFGSLYDDAVKGNNDIEQMAGSNILGSIF